jgi:hypothetical protein
VRVDEGTNKRANGQASRRSASLPVSESERKKPHRQQVKGGKVTKGIKLKRIVITLKLTGDF